MLKRRTQWYLQLLMMFMAGWLLSSSVQASSLPDFTKLAADNQASVVNISTLQKASSRQGGNITGQVPEFFRHFFEGLEDHFTLPERDRESQGSGFIISSDGYILTNYHVVHGADEVLVRLQDLRELKATVVGTDKQSDMAVLKIDAKGLQPVKIGSSDELKVGEWVLAIGAPFGFESTVTAGIVSAVGRSLPNENYVPFIQTDVAINPGNSGGPLFNMAGEVVGINSQIISRSGGFMGLSFAIPIDMAMEVVDQLKETGEVKRGWLGVMIQGVDRDLAASFGLDKPMGALVAQVSPDSPALKAGVKAGDVIIKFNGIEVKRSSHLPHLVGRVKPGTKVNMEVLRNGKKRTLKVVVEAMENETAATVGSNAKEEASREAVLGLQVEALTAEERKKLDIEEGVRVLEVGKGPAANAGVRRGDVVRSVNNQPVNSAEDLERVAKDLPKETWVPLLVQRGEYPMFLAIKVEK
ncbi:MAG TPA: DegQ family serine endoprotease [Alcanivoracaceae bacterium]|nr:DegQ family serine endoprotease [Alcanivoracaceae bacterium]